MKKYISLTVLFVILTNLISVSFAESTNINLQIGSEVATVNGEKTVLDAAPYIEPKTGRTMVPLRFIIENLGGNVSWDGTNKVIVIYETAPETTYTDAEELFSTTDGYIFQVNNKAAIQYLNWMSQPGWQFRGYGTYFDENRNIIFGEGFVINPYVYPKNGFELDQEPIIKEDRVLVPIRTISERMGYNVLWNAEDKTIQISKS